MKAIPDYMRFSTHRLCEFEVMGGDWESIEISERTDKYTDRLCRIELDGLEAYTHIRFYKDGYAMIGVPFYDPETKQLCNDITPDIVNKMNDILFNHSAVKKLDPFVQKRINHEAMYAITTALTWIIILVLILLTLFKVLSILECGIGIALLIVHLIAKRKIWKPKIQLIGSEGRNYYEKYR